ncbi:MAG: hypothetical protein WCB49_07950 [Gammaproteobacteria bacterium]
MRIALKYQWAGKHRRNLALLLAIVFATSACTSPRTGNTPASGGADGSVKPLVRIAPIYPLVAEVRKDKGVCVSTQFTLTTSGRVASLKIVGAYPTIRHVQKYGYVSAMRHAMEGWRFAAQPKAGDVSSTPKILQKMIFIRIPPGTVSSDMALHLVCRQPYLLTPGPISILSDSAPQPGLSETTDEAAHKTRAGTVTGTSVSIPLTMHNAKSWQGVENIQARFCVDPQKRIANVVMKGGTLDGRAVALAALDALPTVSVRDPKSASQPQHLATIEVTGSTAGDESVFDRIIPTENKVRKAGIPIWACGLRVKVRLLAKPQGRTIGLIKRTSSGQLSGESNMPPIIASHSPHQKLVVPTGENLPDKARIEVEFCITPGGSPVMAHVVSAKPAKILNHAALEVVAGWRFARRGHRMCNVYQQVGFKIPHPTGGA